MAISKIEIKNFTVFEDVAIDFSGGINLIMGENGTGKTHLLKLLYACNHGTTTQDDNNYITKMENLNECFNINYNSLFKNSRKPIEIISCLSELDENYFFKIYPLVLENDINDINNLPIGTILSKISENGVSVESLRAISLSLIYIPAKDMLTHSKGLLAMANKYRKDMPFDKTLLDIIDISLRWKLDEIPRIAKNIIPKLENIIGGKIIVENDTFFVQKDDNRKVNFSVEAEGIKKIGLLWQLLMNESLTNETILLWDEPEANINPKLIPDLVEIMLELSRNGVQIFVATHDYIFAKYFEVKRKENDTVLFHSLYKTDNGVQCESNENFRDLKNNSIISAFDALMNEVIDKNLGD